MCDLLLAAILYPRSHIPAWTHQISSFVWQQLPLFRDATSYEAFSVVLMRVLAFNALLESAASPRGSLPDAVSVPYVNGFALIYLKE